MIPYQFCRKKLAISLCLSLLLGSQFSKANDDCAVDPAGQNVNQPQEEGEWANFKKQLKNIEIKYRLSIPLVSLANGVAINPGIYDSTADTSINKKYSGIDEFTYGASVWPDLFGISLPVDVNLSSRKKITYFRLFDCRKAAITRKPYNPIENLPNSAQKFQKSNYKPGTFISYSAPMTFTVSKEFFKNKFMSKALDSSIGASFVVNGEFDIQIFVMSDKHIRLKIFAIKDITKSVSLPLTIHALTPQGQLAKQVFKTNLLPFYMSDSETEMYIADYVLNMSTENGRQIFDLLVGKRMQMYTLDGLTQIVENNLTKTPIKAHKEAVADLEAINKLASKNNSNTNADINLVNIGRSFTKSSSLGLSIKLFNLFNLNLSGNSQEAQIAISKSSELDEQEQLKNADYYILNQNFSNFSFNTANVWGEKDIQGFGILLNTQRILSNNGKLNLLPTNLFGMFFYNNLEDRSIDQREYNKYFEKLFSVLPTALTEKIKNELPRWQFKNDDVGSVYINSDVFFKPEALQAIANHSEEAMISIIGDLVQSIGHWNIKSRPSGVDFHADGASGKYMNAYSANKLKEAFEPEIRNIAAVLFKMFRKNTNNTDFSYDYNAYKNLYAGNKLFQEIQIPLFLKLIPENLLNTAIVGKLTISGSDEQSGAIYYPSNEAYNDTKMQQYHKIIQTQSNLTNRSFNIHEYMKENGDIIPVDDILQSKK